MVKQIPECFEFSLEAFKTNKENKDKAGTLLAPICS